MKINQGITINKDNLPAMEQALLQHEQIDYIVKPHTDDLYLFMAFFDEKHRELFLSIAKKFSQ